MLSFCAAALSSPRPQGSLQPEPSAASKADYWEARVRDGETKPLTPLIPNNSASLVSTETNLGYVPSLYRGTACESWCANEIKVDRATAEAAGRTHFPPNDIADWAEKCTWDAYCAGCAPCANVTCDAALCPIITDPAQNPAWKKQTLGFDVVCNWAPCYGCAECQQGSQQGGSDGKVPFNATWWLGSARCETDVSTSSVLYMAPLSYSGFLGECTHMGDFNVTNATTSEVSIVQVYVRHTELEKQPDFYLDNACTIGDGDDYIEGDKPFRTDGECNEMLEFACGRVGSLEIEPTSAGSHAQPTSPGKSALALWKRALGHDATPGATKASVKIVAL